LFELRSVAPTKAREGYLLDFDDFVIYLRNNSKILEQLLEALAYYCSEMTGFAIYVEVDSSEKKGYAFAMDENTRRDWTLTKGKYSYLAPEKIITGKQKSSNPFIPNAPSSPTSSGDDEANASGDIPASRKKTKSAV
jgi:hypothetical protein